MHGDARDVLLGQVSTHLQQLLPVTAVLAL
jgi:hypothetical protein